MTPELLDGLFAHDVEHAQLVMRQTGSLTPMFVIHSKGRGSIVLGLFSNAEEKFAVYAMVRAQAVAEGAFAIGFMSEAWVTVLSPDTLPRREEMLWVGQVARVAGKIECRAKAVRIERDEAGGLRDLVPLDDMDRGAPEGLLAELLDPEPPDADQRAEAAALLAAMRRVKPEAMREIPLPTTH